MNSAILPFLLFLGASCSSISDSTTGTPASSGDDQAPTESGDCCELHGTLDDDKPNTCAVSQTPRCVGCDGDPVLCQTSCVFKSQEVPCCLANGETVPCPE